MDNYEIKEVTIMDNNSTEIENYYPKERFIGNIEDYRKKVLNDKYPDIKQRFPNLKKSDLSVLLTHKKIE